MLRGSASDPAMSPGGSRTSCGPSRPGTAATGTCSRTRRRPGGRRTERHLFRGSMGFGPGPLSRCAAPEKKSSLARCTCGERGRAQCAAEVRSVSATGTRCTTQACVARHIGSRRTEGKTRAGSICPGLADPAQRRAAGHRGARAHAAARRRGGPRGGARLGADQGQPCGVSSHNAQSPNRRHRNSTAFEECIRKHVSYCFRVPSGWLGSVLWVRGAHLR